MRRFRGTVRLLGAERGSRAKCRTCRSSPASAPAPRGYRRSASEVEYRITERRRMRLHGEEFEATTTELGRTAGWLRIIREPVQYWWIYMTDSTSGKSGWMRMGGVTAGVNEPLHADACR